MTEVDNEYSSKEHVSRKEYKKMYRKYVNNECKMYVFDIHIYTYVENIDEKIHLLMNHPNHHTVLMQMANGTSICQECVKNRKIRGKK